MTQKSIKYQVSSIKGGFTLIELLVTVSVIGVLLSLGFISYSGAQKQARDVQRKADIKQYQNALEVFANQNDGLYPSRKSANGVSAYATLCSDLELSACVDDPRVNDDVSFIYLYQSDGSDGGIVNATKYVLWAKLEDSSDFWVVCSTGTTGKKSQSGFSVSGGECPL